ncbi:hypothetical protein BH20ACI1_BH20ACI1_00530 [soil metagenome]
MSANKTNNHDYQSIKSTAGNGSAKNGDQIKSLQKSSRKNNDLSLKNLHKTDKEIEKLEISSKKETVLDEIPVSVRNNVSSKDEPNYAETPKQKKKQKKVEKDCELLSSDRWLTRNGHTLSYAGLYLFSILVLLRPYEITSSLSFLSATAFYFAVATLAIYIPTQFSTEGSLTVLSTEVKCVLVLTLIALLTIPIAKNPSIAWDTFSDTFIKAVLMFIVMINVVRTRKRLMGLVWLSLIIGVYLSYTAIDLYMKGEFKVEGYRVGLDIGGQYGNPNDFALHLVTMIPIAITLGIASRSKIMRVIYFAITLLFIGGNMVTFSRGGFIGLIAAAVVLSWKLGRKSRLKVSIVSSIVGGLFIILAPGNYGLRLLSIFIPALDPVGSSDQRKELLIRSIIVTLRNPWGIGIGNFPIVGVRNLVTHNSFTQVSSELGILGLAAYLIFLISPFRKLGAIERTLFAKEDYNWFYYLSIGLQASIIAYMFASFFVSVAYIWFVYYLIAYAVAFRRIYKAAEGIKETEEDVFGLQTV